MKLNMCINGMSGRLANNCDEIFAFAETIANCADIKATMQSKCCRNMHLSFDVLFSTKVDYGRI